MDKSFAHCFRFCLACLAFGFGVLVLSTIAAVFGAFSIPIIRHDYLSLAFTGSFAIMGLMLLLSFAIAEADRLRKKKKGG